MPQLASSRSNAVSVWCAIVERREVQLCGSDQSHPLGKIRFSSWLYTGARLRSHSITLDFNVKVGKK